MQAEKRQQISTKRSTAKEQWQINMKGKGKKMKKWAYDTQTANLSLVVNCSR